MMNVLVPLGDRIDPTLFLSKGERGRILIFNYSISAKAQYAYLNGKSSVNHRGNAGNRQTPRWPMSFKRLYQQPRSCYRDFKKRKRPGYYKRVRWQNMVGLIQSGPFLGSFNLYIHL